MPEDKPAGNQTGTRAKPADYIQQRPVPDADHNDDGHANEHCSGVPSTSSYPEIMGKRAMSWQTPRV